MTAAALGRPHRESAVKQFKFVEPIRIYIVVGPTSLISGPLTALKWENGGWG